MKKRQILILALLLLGLISGEILYVVILHATALVLAVQSLRRQATEPLSKTEIRINYLAVVIGSLSVLFFIALFIAFSQIHINGT